MIVLLQDGIDAASLEQLLRTIEGLGLRAATLDGPKGRALELSGPDLGRALSLRGAPGVREILTRRTPLQGGEPLWPHFALRVGVLAVLTLVALALLTAFFPPGLGDRADSVGAGAVADAVTGVEWYLRPQAAVLAGLPPALEWAGGGLLLLVWVALLAWPALDRADEATPAGRALARLVRGAGLLVLVAFVLLALGVGT